ncbi:hypothetical protein LWI28_028295 [Acer negundo]|uniref:Uncharacterized protein n=1 Tax=Acer negundo TaxID=4023 RepID=A0AAD5J7U5_ACENE|nr:hypothetical protein LWI28_028295 [Acer negundo]
MSWQVPFLDDVNFKEYAIQGLRIDARLIGHSIVDLTDSAINLPGVDLKSSSGGGCGIGAAEEGSTTEGAGGAAGTGSGTCYGSTVGRAKGIATTGFGTAGRVIGVTTAK